MTDIVILYRLEPGCLGPEGREFIVEFCQFAAPLIASQSPAFMRWQLEPRFDKTLPEWQCHFHGKVISEAQAARLLAHFSTDIDALIEQLNEHLTLMIDQYFGRW